MSLAQMTAESVINALANAFGGMSQIPDSTVGEAIHGRYNNGGLGRQNPDDVVQAAARVIYFYWRGNGGDVEQIRTNIQRGFDTAAARIAAR